MLVTAVLPFCDFRALADSGFSRLSRPAWPNPRIGDYVRGIGGVRQRLLRGFDSWVGESSLVCGVPAMAMQLPRWANGSRLSLVRKACYFDNLVNGRIEFLVRVDAEPSSYADAASMARFILDRPVTLRRNRDDPAPLRRMSRGAARLWAEATVKRGSDPLFEWIKPRNPIVVIETEVLLPAVGPGAPARVRLSIEGNGKPFELFTIHPDRDAWVGRRSGFRTAARAMRTYLIRMLQDVEALSQICAEPKLHLDDDRVQEVFNEYTRHIVRSRAKIENSTDLTAYCYAVFDQLYPGHIEGLRTQVVASAMRPNVRKKVLEFLDEVEKAVLQFNIKELTMGDRYGEISGQTVAVGPGAQAAGRDIINEGANPDLIAALRELAGKVRESGNEDADTEAVLIEAAAAKAEEGDEKGAAGLLKKVGNWALGIGTTVGTAALTGFLKTHGIG